MSYRLKEATPQRVVLESPSSNLFGIIFMVAGLTMVSLRFSPMTEEEPLFGQILLGMGVAFLGFSFGVLSYRPNPTRIVFDAQKGYVCFQGRGALEARIPLAEIERFEPRAESRWKRGGSAPPFSTDNGALYYSLDMHMKDGAHWILYDGDNPSRRDQVQVALEALQRTESAPRPEDIQLSSHFRVQKMEGSTIIAWVPPVRWSQYLFMVPVLAGFSLIGWSLLDVEDAAIFAWIFMIVPALIGLLMGFQLFARLGKGYILRITPQRLVFEPQSSVLNSRGFEITEQAIVAVRYAPNSHELEILADQPSLPTEESIRVYPLPVGDLPATDILLFEQLIQHELKSRSGQIVL